VAWTRVALRVGGAPRDWSFCIGVFATGIVIRPAAAVRIDFEEAVMAGSRNLQVLVQIRPWCPAVFSASKRGQREVGAAEDLNPHGPCGPTDFHAHLLLSPPLLSAGFGSGLSVHRAWIWLQVSGAARLVSTPSNRNADCSGRLGSGSPFHRVPRL